MTQARYNPEERFAIELWQVFKICNLQDLVAASARYTTHIIDQRYTQGATLEQMGARYGPAAIKRLRDFGAHMLLRCGEKMPWAEGIGDRPDVVRKLLVNFDGPDERKGATLYALGHLMPEAKCARKLIESAALDTGAQTACYGTIAALRMGDPCPAIVDGIWKCNGVPFFEEIITSLPEHIFQQALTALCREIGDGSNPPEGILRLIRECGAKAHAAESAIIKCLHAHSEFDRANAVRALVSITGACHLDLLRAALQDPDMWVKTAVLDAIASLGKEGKPAFEDVVQCLAEDELKYAAQKALNFMGGD